MLFRSQHAYDSSQPSEVRRDWAELSLLANRRMRGDSAEGSARELQQGFMLRTWVIEHLGPEHENSDWSPEALGADTLAALGFSPSEAAPLAATWRELPIEQIRELRRHKNLTAHLKCLLATCSPARRAIGFSPGSRHANCCLDHHQAELRNP